MHCNVVIGLLIISALHVSSNALGGISDKLDFGDTKSFRTENAQYKTLNIPIQYRVVKSEEKPKSDDFDGIGVVCVSGGCNTTKSTDSTNGSIQTDVVVHVQTNVDVKQNNTSSSAEEDPDVPVVVGLKGTNLDSITRPENPNFNDDSLIVTELEEPITRPKFIPNNGPFGSSLHTAVFPSTGSILNPSFSSVDRSLNTGLDFNTDTRQSFNPSISARYDPSRNIPSDEPRVDISIKTIPEITVTTSDTGRNLIKDIKYTMNGVELQIPYFEPAYHNHYFGEHPPPQYVWFPKKNGNSINPVEFKNVPRPSWSANSWDQFSRRNQEIPHRHTSTNTCICKEGQGQSSGITPGLKWYPNRRVSQADPGSQINDKLAPLDK